MGKSSKKLGNITAGLSVKRLATIAMKNASGASDKGANQKSRCMFLKIQKLL